MTQAEVLKYLLGRIDALLARNFIVTEADRKLLHAMRDFVTSASNGELARLTNCVNQWEDQP